MMSSETARAASPAVLMKAYGKQGPGQWIDVTSPVIIFNPATGKSLVQSGYYVTLPSASSHCIVRERRSINKLKLK